MSPLYHSTLLHTCVWMFVSYSTSSWVTSLDLWLIKIRISSSLSLSRCLSQIRRNVLKALMRNGVYKSEMDKVKDSLWPRLSLAQKQKKKKKKKLVCMSSICLLHLSLCVSLTVCVWLPSHNHNHDQRHKSNEMCYLTAKYSLTWKHGAAAG